MTQAFAPLLGADRSLVGKPGRIVNVSSVSGKIAYPFAGPYSASKFALEGFSESLRRELILFGIDVIVIAPGAVKTPIWDKVEAADGSRSMQCLRVPAAVLCYARARHMPMKSRAARMPKTVLELLAIGLCLWVRRRSAVPRLVAGRL